MNDTTTNMPIAVLISGGGTTLLNLLRKIDQGQLAVEVKLVISSNPNAAGLQFPANAGITTKIASPKSFDSPEAFSEAIFEPCRQAGVELVVMGGFLKHVPIPPDFENRVMNIHPGLIPAFAGKGYYGSRVHEAVLEYGAKVSGCTVHFVDNLYDHGPVILQVPVPLREDDTPETLAERIFQAECEVYPHAINLYAAGRVTVEGRRVRISE